MGNTLLIVDAMNLIRRIHAVSESQQPSEKSQLIATLNGVVNSCNKLLRHIPSTHVIAVFDGQQPSWRSEVWPEYKQGRTPAPTPLVDFLPNIQDALLANGIESLVSEQDEADDLIATLTLTVAKNNKQSCIVSTDKGFFQLHQPLIKQYDYFTHQWLTAEQFCQKTGIKRDQLIDYWCLTGVGSSNIKGVPGIGPKTATKLLGQYPSLEMMLASQDETDKALNKVKLHSEEALVSKKLVILKADIPLGFNLKDIRYSKIINKKLP
ncbi:flap endonuclease Xni [Motilimonas sp. 1_MG-2023]|uniref:flap endonuclease Xni n=1 Tax=Motilimonas sp. 1_MG-2023 TaxID=3062672 RepID=UPI0026E22187|nr:flap endonuclease Xni [Motilimonas sp. 1_MG-2023]MDO6527811.1 flap endonuclease Xni [Motilimonas sp. 1_MG-2023]